MTCSEVTLDQRNHAFRSRFLNERENEMEYMGGLVNRLIR